jgi:SAM-dependent methyltransferase
MHPEIHNVGNLAKHLGKSVARGRLRDARACAIVIGWRLREAIAELRPSRNVTCDYCGWSGRRFKTFLAGAAYRHDAVCPQCLSLERHREFILLFRRLRPLLAERLRILDIGPTRAFAEACRAAPDLDYVSIDRVSKLAMLHMDVQRLAFAAEVFDVVVCYHVLDYVSDDRGAMSEIRRVLKRSGMAILEETIDASRRTAEWPAPTPYDGRVRQYGEDFADRLGEAGLTARRIRGSVFLAFKDAANPLVEVAARVAGH